MVEKDKLNVHQHESTVGRGKPVRATLEVMSCHWSAVQRILGWAELPERYH